MPTPDVLRANSVAADRHYVMLHLPELETFKTEDVLHSPHHRDGDSPRGSFGTVHFRLLRGKIVAVKEPFNNKEAMICFFNEVHVAACIPHCMNVVRTLGFVHPEAHSPPCSMVMTKYIETLHSFLQTGGRSFKDSYSSADLLDQKSGSMSMQAFGYVRVLLHLLAGAANGLAHMHACGIVHNDLSVSNIFVDHPAPDKSFISLPEAVVGDMGRAAHEEGCGEILYGCSWLAKKTRHEKRLSAASDVFSLGTIVLSALGGVGRDSLDVHSIVDVDAVTPSIFITENLGSSAALVSQVSSGLGAIIKTCTDKIPGNRPSALQVRGMIRALSNSI